MQDREIGEPLDGRTIVLRVDDSGARYPLTIDPFVQQGDKLTATGEIGNGLLGVSVALSADGNTALVGADDDSTARGAAFVFDRSGSAWREQAQGKLIGTGESADGHFGTTVALSADGETALVGAPFDAGNDGAVWAFKYAPPTPGIIGGGGKVMWTRSRTTYVPAA